MKIKILQGGQTGVDRGAWRGAKECGLDRGGWMPSDGCDELGLIPADVRADLRPALNGGGNKSRTIANMVDADAVMLVVPNAEKGASTPGTRLTWRVAFNQSKRRILVDGTGPQIQRLEEWLGVALDRFRSDTDSAIRMFRLMIAGPRASLWPDGEVTAGLLVRRIASVAGGMP